MQKSVKAIATLALMSLGITQSSWAFPAPVPTTYYFTGSCTDCQGTVTGTLVLNNYTLGQPITSSNFASFSYSGTNLLPAFTITSSTPSLFVSGSISAIPGANVFQVSGNAGGFIGFGSLANGTWHAGSVADQGVSGTWSNQLPAVTPAPSTSILLITGLLAVGALSWRRRRIV